MVDMVNEYRKKILGQPNKSKRELDIWYLYRLTLDEHEALMNQGCFICGSKENLCIDHDHRCCPTVDEHGIKTRKTCGKCIRGVLCRRHNLAEGNLNSDPKEVRKLLEYLEK